MGTTPSLEQFQQGKAMPMLAQMLSPTALDPLVQIFGNTDGFGRTLGPSRYPGQEYLPSSQLTWDSTPNGYKWLAQEINALTGGSAVERGLVDWVPSTYQVLWETLEGSMGRFLAQTAGLPFAAFAGKAPDLREVPVVRQFISTQKSTKFTQEYHNAIARIEQKRAEEKEIRNNSGNSAIALQEFRTENAGLLRLMPAARAAEAEIRKLRKQASIAQDNKQESRFTYLQEQIKKRQQAFNRLFTQVDNSL